MFHFDPSKSSDGVAQGVVLLAQRCNLLRLLGLGCLRVDREVNSFFELGCGVLTYFSLVDLEGVVPFIEMRYLKDLLIESLIKRNPGENIFRIGNTGEGKGKFPI